MANKVSNAGLALIMKYEGCPTKNGKPYAYTDSVGVWTIGWGTTNAVTKYTGITVKSGLTITQAQADKALEAALNGVFVPAILKYDSKYHWTQGQLDALASFAYNLGAKTIDTLTANGTRTIAEISEHILSYNKAGGKVLSGLTKRRTAEKKMFDEATKKSTSSSFTKGKSYTCKNATYVRESVGGEYADYKSLSDTLKAKCTKQADGSAKFNVGQSFTVQAIGKTSAGAIYGQLKSGNWLCLQKADGTKNFS